MLNVATQIPRLFVSIALRMIGSITHTAADQAIAATNVLNYATDRLDDIADNLMYPS